MTHNLRVISYDSEVVINDTSRKSEKKISITCVVYLFTAWLNICCDNTKISVVFRKNNLDFGVGLAVC